MKMTSITLKVLGILLMTIGYISPNPELVKFVHTAASIIRGISSGIGIRLR